MFALLFRRIRFAWVWAVAMLVWRNRVEIMHALRSLYARIRGVQPPPQSARAVEPTGRI